MLPRSPGLLLLLWVLTVAAIIYWWPRGPDRDERPPSDPLESEPSESEPSG